MQVHADRGEQAHVAQQRVEQLADVRFGIAAQAFLPEQLLGVVRPAFGEGVADEDPAEHRARTVGVQELQEVAGPDLVHRGEEQVRLAGHVGVLLGLRPLGIGRRDVVDRRQIRLVGAGDLDVGEVLAVEGRRLGHLRLLRARDRDDLVLDEELLELDELLARARHGTAGRLLLADALDALAHAHTGRVQRAGLAQRARVALEIGAPRGFERGQRDRDALGHLEHFRVARGPERLDRRGVRQVVLELLRQRGERHGGLFARVHELLLQRGVAHARESQARVVAVEVGQAREERHAVVREGLGQRQVQVLLDLRRRAQHRARIADEGAQAHLGRRIGPHDVDARVERVGVVGRVAEGLLRDREPEEVVVDALQQVVALEALGRVELVAGEGAGALAHALQARDLGLDPGHGPVRQLAVELVLALVDREGRVGHEVRGQELVDEHGPGLAGL